MSSQQKSPQKESGRMDWSWLPKAMPGVAVLMKDKRQQFGDAHVNECWKRGVVQQEAGWFFAREGALAVGVPFSVEAWAAFYAEVQDLGPALLLMREPAQGGAENGAA